MSALNLLSLQLHHLKGLDKADPHYDSAWEVARAALNSGEAGGYGYLKKSGEEMGAYHVDILRCSLH